VSTPIPPTDPEQPQAARSTPIEDAARDLEAVLHEVKRVVIGQDAMLERVLVALLSGGHVLLEGVPGLAKTLTVKTLSDALGGVFRRVQFTPDLVPADLVGTRIWRPDTGTFETQLGPVFGNLLLADEINRAPAKVQSALLEVMQERQVTLGGQSFPLPSPFLVLATQNPIESEGTYPLPEAQVDRFLLKVVVGYPSVEDEASVVHASVGAPVQVRQIITPERLLQHRETVRGAHVDPQVVRFAVALADATRHPERYGLGDLQGAIDVGASPRGPIGLVQAAQALAVLRGRDYVTSRDVRALALDVLRHRLVLSYEAHADGLTPDDVLERVLRAVDPNAGEPAPLIGEPQAPGGGDQRWSDRSGQALPERHNGASAAAAADAA
jgi:MoxR-like ATPase